MIEYTYTCKDKVFTLTNEETAQEHGLFCVKCHSCCNLPVYHLLYRKTDNE